jgi:cytochrome b subunit of formate dehydrogenase
MNPRGARRLLHALHAWTTLALLATGFLIQWPDLRALVVGGYGRELATLHVWVGWVFTFAPPLALALSPRPLLADVARRFDPLEASRWRKAHVVITLVAGGLLGVTGVILWWPDDFGALPLATLDRSLDLHIAASWIFAVSLPLHLWVARREIWERVRLLLGGEPPPLFEFADDPDEDPP